LVLALGLSLFCAAFFPARRFEAVMAAFRLPVLIALAIPGLLILPFFLEATGWAAGLPRMPLPGLSLDWLFVAAGAGIVAPLAAAGAWQLYRGPPAPEAAAQLHKILIGAAILPAVGLLGVALANYPDGGLKSALWLRLALVPLAALGLDRLFRAKASRSKFIGIAAIAVYGLAAIYLNLPTTDFLIRSAYFPIDPGVKQMLAHARALPPQSKIALLSPEPVLAILLGRSVDFDFRRLRPDSYMPLDGRIRAARFWDGITEGNADALHRLTTDYDIVIVPVNSALRVRMDVTLGIPQTIAGYLIYRTRR
jgi:hypothetical protein